MKTGTKLSIAAAALSGLLMGTAAHAASAPVVPVSQEKSSVKKAVASASQQGVKFTADDDKDKDKHDCKGKNDCKGKGGCKTGDGGCKGKNTCKGKGGCSTKDDKKKDDKAVTLTA